MKDKIDLIYISLSGNTDSFVKRLRDYLLLNTKLKEVNLLNVKLGLSVSDDRYYPSLSTEKDDTRKTTV